MRNDVARRRENRGLSQGELADAIQVTRQTINAVERDRYNPSLTLAFALADYFDCHVGDIFDPQFE